MLSNKIKTLRSQAFIFSKHKKQGLDQVVLKRFYPSFNNPTIKPKRLLSNWLKNASDQKRRSGVFKTELSRLLHKSLIAYMSNTTYENFIFNDNLTRRMRRITKTRIRNRCVLTSHPQTIGHFGLSRIAFRRLANLGLIPGLAKV